MKFSLKQVSRSEVQKALFGKTGLPLAMSHYPSRGQSFRQEVYQTKLGKIFVKEVSAKNHRDCQISPQTGSIAEREFWACALAQYLEVPTPPLWLIDKMTTAQEWLDFPDAHSYVTTLGKMNLQMQNIFDCALFDWLTAQQDRHDANYLYDYAAGLIVLIDSAHGFLRYDGSLPDYLKIYEMAYPRYLAVKNETKTKEKVKSLTVEKLKKLVPLRDKDEVGALARRLLQLNGVSCIADIINLYRGGGQ